MRRLADPARKARRGQGLVEFALLAPVILILLLVTIDFGRALYGWVVLQNSARIAANFAGLNPDGWRDDIASVKARYSAEVASDLTAANCDSFVTSGSAPPDPTFVDGPDQAVVGGPADTIYDVGDLARVSLSCTFHPITPIISAVLGNAVQLQANSEFRIRAGTVTGLANPTQIPPPATPTPPPSPSPSSSSSTCPAPVVQFTGTSGVNTTPPDGNTPLTVSFTDQSTADASCSITAWHWSFGDGQTSNVQNPTLTFTKTGNPPRRYDATLTVTSSVGSPSLTKNNYITVR
jgi:PKD repeat protein